MSDIDVSELRDLSASLGRASSVLIEQAHVVIAKGALNIKNDTREHVSDDDYWRKLAATVNYEQVGLSAEIGFEDRGQGELAGIYEFGSARRSPHPTLMPAFAREVPRFEKAMGDLVSKVGDSL